MISLSERSMTLNGSLGEIREIRLYSNSGRVLEKTLRKASDEVTGNNEFFEYIGKYFGLRQKYSQDLLLNVIDSDLSDYSIQELKIFEKYGVPVSNNSEYTSESSKYFGTVNINERTITPFLAPAGIDMIQIVDSDEEEKLSIDVRDDYKNYDKILMIVVDQKSPNSIVIVNLPSKSWSTSKEQERWLKDKYARNDEKYKTISSIKKCGPLVFDVLSGNILGTEILKLTSLLDKKLNSKNTWNPSDYYKQSESIFWGDDKWFSLAPKNKSTINPKLSPLWSDEDPLEILNKRIRIIYDPKEVLSITPDKFITVDSTRNVRFVVTLQDGLKLSKSGISPEIEGDIEEVVSENKYIFNISVSKDMIEPIVIKANKTYSAVINKIKETTPNGEETKTASISGEPLFDSNNNFTGFRFDLSSIKESIISLVREDGTVISPQSNKIYIDTDNTLEIGVTHKYTLTLSTNYYIVHVTKGDEIFEFDKVFEVVSAGDGLDISYYPMVNFSRPTIITTKINNEEIIVSGNYDGFSAAITENNGIVVIKITNIRKDLNISVEAR